MLFLSTVVWYNPNKYKNHTSNPFITSKMENYFSTLGFWYFEFLFIYERIQNQIRIRIFSIFVLALMIFTKIRSQNSHCSYYNCCTIKAHLQLKHIAFFYFWFSHAKYNDVTRYIKLFIEFKKENICRDWSLQQKEGNKMKIMYLPSLTNLPSYLPNG